MNPTIQPPHSREAEQAVLGSMLRDNLVIADVMTVLRAESFYADAHRKLYGAMVAIYGDSDRPVDMVTLADELQRRKQVDEVGGYPYISELWDASPTAAKVLYYARIVRDKAAVRAMIHSSTEILRDAYDPSFQADELLERAQQQVFSLLADAPGRQLVGIDRIVQECWDRIDWRAQQGGQETGVPTGLGELDAMTCGLQPGELIVLAARTSVGKTALACQITRHAAVERQMPVFFVSLEMGRADIAERLMVGLAGVDGQKVRRPPLSDLEVRALMACGQRLQKSPLHIDASSPQTMAKIAANARRLKLRHGIRLIVVDYLQMVEPENRRDNRQEQVALITDRLKGLAKELEVPVLALAQINRAPESRGDGQPRLADVRESGNIEAAADVVLLLWNPEADRQWLVECIVAKQRNGPTGPVLLEFKKNLMQWSEWRERPVWDGASSGGRS